MVSNPLVIDWITESIKSTIKTLSILIFEVLFKENYVIVPLNQIRRHLNEKEYLIYIKETKTNLDGYSKTRFNEAAISYLIFVLQIGRVNQ